jgi:AcrR family transcriptional regulator
VETQAEKAEASSPSKRLSKEKRRQQLLETALSIVREEGADRLTLGHLAARAGVSKPIAYDHFGTRAGLLIELYKIRNAQQMDALRSLMANSPRSLNETIETFALHYVRSSAEMCAEWHAVSAALAGSEETDLVYRELMDSYVEFFASILQPFKVLPPDELQLHCVGMIGAGEALVGAMTRGIAGETETAKAFVSLISGSLGQ